VPARGKHPLAGFYCPRGQGDTPGLIGHAHLRQAARCGQESQPFAGDYAGPDGIRLGQRNASEANQSMGCCQPRHPLHIQRAGGTDLRVFLRSGLNCWSPLPGSGRREAGPLPISWWKGEDAGEWTHDRANHPIRPWQALEGGWH